MDIVISYVDQRDVSWWRDKITATCPSTLLSCHLKALDNPHYSIPLDCRYRSGDLLKYQLRGIEQHLPFIDKVHLVVASMSQVPSFINPSTVNIVLHKDFIPEKFLPTFNSITIESFFHNIRELSDEFIYLNDDFFIVQNAEEEDFFSKHKPCIKLKQKILNPNKTGYDATLIRMNELLRRKLDIPIEYDKEGKEKVIIPVHGLMPLSKKMYLDAYDLCGDEILASITPMRNTSKNLTPYIFGMLQYYRQNIVDHGLKLEYVQFNAFKPENYTDSIDPHKIFEARQLGLNTQKESFLRRTEEALTRNSCQQLCLNDNERMSPSVFNEIQPLVQQMFIEKYPNRSKYELGYQ